MAEQGDCADKGAATPAVLPVCISDKAILAAQELRLPSPRPPTRLDSFRCRKVRSGATTWMMAAIALPTIGILLLLTLLLVAEPLETSRKLGVNEAAFWKSRWRKSHIPRRNIFILDINSPTFPSSSKLDLLEACLKQNKYHEIYQVTINEHAKQERNVTGFAKLKKKYTNFHYIFPNAPSYFRGSIFEDAVEDPPSHMLFKAQLLILWKYAGMVLSSNWLPLQPLDPLFSKSDKKLVIGTNNGQIGAMSVSNTCNAKLFEIMREIKKLDYAVGSQLDAIDRVALKSKAGFKHLDSPQLCNNNTISAECLLMRNVGPVTYKPSVARLVKLRSNVAPELNLTPNEASTPTTATNAARLENLTSNAAPELLLTPNEASTASIASNVEGDLSEPTNVAAEPNGSSNVEEASISISNAAEIKPRIYVRILKPQRTEEGSESLTEMSEKVKQTPEPSSFRDLDNFLPHFISRFMIFN